MAPRRRAPHVQHLTDHLASLTVEGTLYEALDSGRVRCHACGHDCTIPDGQEGICRVRFNEGGRLRVPWGYVGALQVDPIEKKPFFHALPGALALSFGMLGCDYHCPFCQNWITSQTLRDDDAVARPRQVTPERLVADALEAGAEVVTSTYNEPLITTEWAVDVFRAAREAGLATSYVSNGNGTPEVLAYLEPHLDLYKVDLKAFTKDAYRAMGGRLEPVLETIAALHAMGKWLEVVTLVIPGMNDSGAEITAMAEFLAGVSPDIPWHVTAFHPDYRMRGPDPTAPVSLLEAARIGREAGLHYVYAGNIPGHVGAWEHTRCPACSAVVIERYGFQVLKNSLEAGCCPGCGAAVPGFWRRPPGG